jgi:ferredoxin
MERAEVGPPLLEDLSKVMADASICGLGRRRPIRCAACSATSRTRSSAMNEPVIAETIEFTLNGATVQAAARRDDHLQAREAPRRRDPAPVLHRRAAARRQLPRLRGGDPGRARAGGLLLPQSREGMVVQSSAASARVHPEDGARAAAGRPPRRATSGDNEHAARRAGDWAASWAWCRVRFPAREQPAPDASHPAMAVNLDACIQCTRCVRACREEQVNDVIGYVAAAAHAQDRVRPRRPDGRQRPAWPAASACRPAPPGR